VSSGEFNKSAPRCRENKDIFVYEAKKKTRMHLGRGGGMPSEKNREASERERGPESRSQRVESGEGGRDQKGENKLYAEGQ